MRDYSTCIFCNEPVLNKKYFMPYKYKAVCCDCFKELSEVELKERISKYSSIIDKFVYHSQHLDW